MFKILLIAILLSPAISFAHSGGTDASGCHTNRKTGDYHCHSKKNKARSRSRSSTSSDGVTTTIHPPPKAPPKSHTEADYQKAWCSRNNGEAEVVLADGTRADCLTATHAIEFDFGRKWAESIGQALYYSIQTGKKPGVVLIIRSDAGNRYWIRLNTVIQHYGLDIETWRIGPEEFK